MICVCDGLSIPHFCRCILAISCDLCRWFHKIGQTRGPLGMPWLYADGIPAPAAEAPTGGFWRSCDQLWLHQGRSSAELDFGSIGDGCLFFSRLMLMPHPTQRCVSSKAHMTLWLTYSTVMNPWQDEMPRWAYLQLWNALDSKWGCQWNDVWSFIDIHTSKYQIQSIRAWGSILSHNCIAGKTKGLRTHGNDWRSLQSWLAVQDPSYEFLPGTRMVSPIARFLFSNRIVLAHWYRHCHLDIPYNQKILGRF